MSQSNSGSSKRVYRMAFHVASMDKLVDIAFGRTSATFTDIPIPTSGVHTATQQVVLV